MGKKVFLTGHTGFKGSWLSLWLQACGSILMGYSLAPNTSPNLFEAGSVASGMHSIIGDVRDLESLTLAVSEFSPEIVIHMAAQPLVRKSYENPVETYSTNVMGTVNILEAVRKTESVKAVVNVTTDKCYENKEWAWGYNEDDAIGGHDPYSNSKGCSELVTAAYRSSYYNYEGSAKIASARAGNVIGGGDWSEDRLVPDILRAFENNKSVKIRNPSATRPWQHVLEPLSGYLCLAEKLYIYGDKYAEPWNFGPEESDVKTVEAIIASKYELFQKLHTSVQKLTVKYKKEAKKTHLSSDGEKREALKVKIGVISSLRDDFEKIWQQQRTRSVEQIVLALQNWCKEVEKSGVEVLKEYSRDLRMLTIQAAR